MANYFLNDDGSLTKKNKKKKGNNYILDSNGKITLNPSEEKLTEKETGVKEEKRKWFNTSSFDDGYQFGDLSKSAFSTYKDIKQDVTKGILGIGEGLIDTGAYLVGGGANLFGNDDLAESTKKFIARDLVEESKLGTILTNITSTSNPALDVGIMAGQSLTDKDKSFTQSFAEKLLNEDFEKNSMLGDKSDSLVQSAGQLVGTMGLQAVGVPWWLTTGVTSFGGGTEEAFSNNAGYGEAGAYGLISAGAEILTEKISGGISFGGKTLDTGLKKLIGEKITNKTLNTLTKFGIDALGEGGEEVLTEVIQNVGKKLTYEDEKTWNELLTSEEAMDGYLEAFIGGAVLGGGMNVGRVTNSIKTGRDYDTGLTTNEQRIVDKEVETRKQEAQKEGKTLTNKEIAKIEEQVKNDLQKGYISTDLIESEFGGEEYNAYKSALDKKTSIESEIKELENKPYAELTVKENERLQAIREELKGIDTNTLKSNLESSMANKIANDGYLQNSYRERNKKSVKFNADLTKYDAKQQETIQKAIDSGILNDTNKTHEFVDMIAKISADKGVSFDFANNQKLKDSGFAIEGKQVNGFVNENGITLNMDSSKALNKVVGHEITHVLEGTALYTELEKALMEYDITKKEYGTRYNELKKLYKGVKDADIKKELTADLVGDYIFNDPDFVNNLSAKQPNVFKKIYNEIKYLFKIATAGSKEAKQLEKAKKIFEDAYKQNATQTDTDTKYSVSEKTQRAMNTMGTTTNMKVAGYLTTDGQFIDFSGKYQGARGDLRQMDHREIADIYTDEEYDNAENKYSNMGTATAIMQDFIDDGNIRTTGTGVDISIEPTKSQYDKLYSYLEYVQRDNGEVFIDLESETKNRENLEYDGKTSISKMINDIKNHYANKTTKYSLTDNQGRQLTEYTIEKTKNSKVRDENGNLMLMYHGSPDGTYEQLRAGTYFTSRKEYADGYQWEGASSISYGKQVNNPRTYEAYLNITNPFSLKNETAKNIYLNEYIKGGNSAYFDPYTDYTDTINNMDEIDWVEGEDLKEWLQENHPEFDGLFLDEGGDGGYGEAEYRWRGYSVIPFSEEQIIKANNNNTEYSLSNPNEEIAPSRNDIYGTDIKLQVEEAIAPLQEEITQLKEVIEDIAPVNVDKLSTTEANDEYRALTEEDLPMLEQQYEEDFKNIDESNIPMEQENTTPEVEEEVTTTKSLEDVRDFDEVGSRKVKAYQYENPEVRPYFQEMATYMLGDLENSIKGERNFNDQLYYDTAGEQGFYGTTRETTSDIAELLDSKYNYSYKDIRKGLEAIIEDHGAENIAVAKRIEFALDKRLREGYTDVSGYEIPANEEYLKLMEAKEITDYYNSLPMTDDMAPVVESVSNTQSTGDIAPIKDIKINDSGQGTLDLGIVKKLKAPEGEFKNKDVEPIDLDKAKQLTIDGTEENLVTKTKKELRRALLGTEAQKEFITSALDNAKNRSMALMNNTDTIRNNELVFGRDAGNMINEIIFQKEIDNEADSIAWQNKERQEIKDLGIKARSKESAAVQKYGEKQYVNDAGEVVAYGDSELASEFSDIATQEKIKRAAQVIRNKYDNYIDAANGVLTKLGFDPIPKRNDYMRHFQELNDVFSRYGIPFNAQSMTEHTLPTDINGLTENWSPQKNYFANMQARKGLKTTYDAITGVDGYIGGIANLIYHTEDIQRGRAFEELIRETYGEDKGFENLDNLPDELKQARAEKIQDNHLSNYAAWLHEWTNHVAGKKSKIDRSVESMFGRKAFSFLDNARKQVGSNMIGFNLSSSLTNLIAPVQAMSKTNKLAVAKGTADTIKNMFIKDDFMNKNKFLTSRMGSDMISKNAWQKIQDAGFIFMKGMDWFSSNQIVRSKYYELRAKGMSEQQAHAEAGKFAARILGDRTKGANAQLYNSKLVGLVTQFQLEVNNQLYSQFYDTYHESKENAQGNALKTAAGMTFTLGQLFAFTHLFGQTFEAIAGYNPTFDVIEMIKTAFGWGEDEDEEKTTGERLKAAADKLVDSLPYVNILTGGGRIPVASGLPNLVGVATGGKDQYGNELTLEDELKKLLFLIPPTGGNQVKKTTQGLSMFDDELPVSGSYTDSGNLRFPVEDTPLNRIQAGLFGQWANKNAGEYFDNERQPLKEKQIQEYADLDMPISDYWEYRDGLKEQKTIEDKFEYINGLDVSDEQKNIMINNIVDREDKVDMSNYDDFGSYEEFDYATKNPEKYSFLEENNISYENYKENKDTYNWAYNNPEKYEIVKQIDTLENYNSYKDSITDIKEQFSTDKGYSTAQRKAAVQKYIESLNLSVPKKIMLEKMAGGYSVKSYEDYMFQYIESLPMSAIEKQALHKQLFD